MSKFSLKNASRVRWADTTFTHKEMLKLLKAERRRVIRMVTVKRDGFMREHVKIKHVYYGYMVEACNYILSSLKETP